MTSGHFSSASSTAGLSAAGGAAAVAAVGGDDDLGVAVEDARREGVGGEAAEHHGVGGAEASAGQHRDDGLGDHRQVDRDPVALLQAQLGQRVGCAGHLVLELGVRDVARVVLGLADPVQGDLVALAGLDVTVDAVVGSVERSADEPLGERRVGPVEHLGRTGAPADALGLLGPEAQPVSSSALVRVGLEVGIGRQIRGRIEVTIFVGQVADALLAHRVLLC